ncbi:MAG TPA: hypothetical protein VMB49_18470 [Acidobacteriaceae bacterium]|nr:hypothetical protein [Acidobacteriaceae bacterium]
MGPRSRVVQRYSGTDVASGTGSLLEYQGWGWLNPSSDAEFAGRIKQTVGQLVCAICGMRMSPSLSSNHKGRTCYFCVRDHKQIFDAAPDQFAAK